MTSLPAHRLRLLPARRFHLALAAVFLGTLGLTLAILHRLVHAQGVAVADPVATAAASTDALMTIVTSYGPLWGGMAIGFGAASTALERNKSTHWIAQGRTLAGITAVVGLGIAGLMAHFGGAAWGGVLMTLVLGVFKLINPTTVTPPASSAPAKAPQAGIVALVALLAAIGAGGAALTSCGAAQRGGQAVIDCTGGNAPGIVATILSTLTEWNKDQADGGCRTDTGYDWGCVKSMAIDKGVQVGGCALAELVQDVIGSSTSSTASSTALASPGVDGVLARATLEDFRAKHAGGAVFHFATGDR